MSKALSGKVALVTGGARGIGAAIVAALAEDGAHIAFSYEKSADVAEKLAGQVAAHGVTARAYKTDSGDAAAVAALVNKVKADFGRIDILVNNAGIFRMGAIGQDGFDAAELDRQYAVNVGGVVAAIRSAVPVLENNGRIITIGSVVAERVSFAGAADYAATKAAVALYTHGIAREVGARGITVNVVQPGPIDTDMNPATSDFAPVLAPQTALGRYGTPAEVAALVRFLAGPSAGYITGAAINIDGGMNA